ncbi:MAG: SRPBCC family protein [Candidatus Dormiibacterota bacterium]|jgi:uncharacterized protein YndB with AHSA1/START domain
MPDHKRDTVSVTRTIEAPAGRIFALITDPAMHLPLDGSGMLRPGVEAAAVSGVGDVFRMSMHNDEMGDYEMENQVVEYEQDRRIAWQPVMVSASRPEDQAAIGNSARQRWGYVLVPAGSRATEVTEFYDCSRSPDWLRKAVRGGERWRAAMTTTLDNLARLSTSDG